VKAAWVANRSDISVTVSPCCLVAGSLAEEYIKNLVFYLNTDSIGKEFKNE
jgi:hypothetical protein